MAIKAEWETLREVLMHRPGVEVEYAMLAPGPFLFERPFNVAKAREEHAGLGELLKENGVRVKLMREEFRDRAVSDRNFREKLEEKILQNVKFFGNMESVKRHREKFREHISYLDPENLFHFLTLEPSIDLKKEESEDVDYPTIYSNLPLANLYFMRDQQAMANETVIVGSMKKKQRKKEVEITEFYFEELYGNDRILRVDEGASFEGGDFIPAGDFALIGTGPRTDVNGALQVINSGKLHYREFGVVENPVYDFIQTQKRSSMVNMHLDTYFNLAADGLAVTSIELCRKAKTVVYTDSGNGMEPGRKTTLYDYLKEKGYNFLDLRISEQLSYSSNFLTIRNNTIVAVKARNVLDKLLKGGHFDRPVMERVEEDLRRDSEPLFPEKKEVREYGVDVIRADLSELTGGYGGAHCMTASLSRG